MEGIGNVYHGQEKIWEEQNSSLQLFERMTCGTGSRHVRLVGEDRANKLMVHRQSEDLENKL